MSKKKGIRVYNTTGGVAKSSNTGIVGVLPGWSYRKAITVKAGDATEQTNYQMKLNIYNSSGTNVTGTAGTLYTSPSAFSSSAFSDLRFTTADGVTPVDYWIESSSASVSAVAWVEMPVVASSASSTTYYMYYGNAGASAASNIVNTFAFGDDFEDASLDTTTRWQVTTNNGTYSESSGVLAIAGGAGYQVISSKTATFTGGYAMRSRNKYTGSGYNWGIGFAGTRGLYSGENIDYSFCWILGANFRFYNGDGVNSNHYDSGVASDTTTYHITEVRRIGSGVDKFTFDDAAPVSGGYSTNNAWYVEILAYTGAINSFSVDWVVVGNTRPMNQHGVVLGQRKQHHLHLLNR
jgi:hypothetical protein